MFAQLFEISLLSTEPFDEGEDSLKSRVLVIVNEFMHGGDGGVFSAADFDSHFILYDIHNIVSVDPRHDF
ncbi:hypothetical protein A2635_02525 [Candidatus Peribacteria bacterium RIFCSPHIGHO2_01_FULL_51_9]|nr:MAG: hypothetical protein A2635_02525 [Candidatus Peribacteria bacterium RIFCSPHIGHO2_01_FULL_51_9]